MPGKGGGGGMESWGFGLGTLSYCRFWIYVNYGIPGFVNQENKTAVPGQPSIDSAAASERRALGSRVKQLDWFLVLWRAD